MKRILVLLAVVVTMTSCSVTRSGTSKTMYINGAGVTHMPVIADLNVSQNKASYTLEVKKTATKTARDTAISFLLEQESADVIVEPTFVTETRGINTELTVTGWPATYKNFRAMTEKDIKLIEVAAPGVSTYTTQPVIGKKDKN